MNIDEWLKKAANKLERAGVATARLDCLVLLEDLLHTNRTQLLAHDDDELTNEQIKILADQIKRRVAHEPLAYIRGKSEFYGREFRVSQDTLEPRPETETMIEIFKTLPKLKTIIDVGTGSGCLAITAKLERPDADITGTDISSKCLKIAQQNAKKFGVTVRLVQGDLLEPVYKFKPDILLCNLPYVPTSHTINKAAMFEPKIAIFGGSDGLDLYRKLFEHIKELAQKPTYILTESLPFQHKELAKIAKKADYKLIQTEDFIQAFQKGSR